MNFTDFPQRNSHFGKPKDWQDEHCGTLPVWQGSVEQLKPDFMELPAHTHLIISKWSPSPEEREAIARGEDVFLLIVGRGMPPVSIFVDSPFPDNDTTISTPPTDEKGAVKEQGRAYYGT